MPHTTLGLRVRKAYALPAAPLEVGGGGRIGRHLCRGRRPITSQPLALILPPSTFNSLLPIQVRIVHSRCLPPCRSASEGAAPGGKQGDELTAALAANFNRLLWTDSEGRQHIAVDQVGSRGLGLRRWQLRV